MARAPAPSPDPAAAQGTGAHKFAAAGARVGGTSLADRNSEVLRARAALQPAVGGDQVAGHKVVNYYSHFGGPDNAFRAYRVPVEELSRPFVAPEGFDGLRSAVHDQPLVVLQGPRGYGKSSAVLRLLHEDSGVTVEVFRLHPETDLRSLSCETVPEGSVLVLDDLSRTAAEQLDTYNVQRLEADLRARRCRLGLTVADSTTVSTTGPASAVLRLGSRPTARQIFDRHLAQLMLGAPLDREQVLAQPGMSELLEEHLAADAPAGHAARLAGLVARAADESGAVVPRVLAELTGRAYEDFAQWFRQLPSLRAHCLAVSLAVLHGLPREAVARHADRLEHLMLPPTASSQSPPPVNPFTLAATVSPQVLRAEVVPELGRTTAGGMPVLAMRYVHRDYPARVLLHVWQEHDAVRPALVQWLGELGRDDALAVRMHAATAVGVLACDALPFLYEQVLVSWAADDDPTVRDSAAAALGPPAADGRVTDAVQTLVANWSLETSPPQLRATAARAYGASIGLTSPSLALRALRRLADTDDVELMVAVSNSLCELLLDGTRALALRVFAEVEALVLDRLRSRQLVGALTFLGLTQLCGAPSYLDDHVRRSRTWPTMLCLSEDDRRLGSVSSRLWRRTLRDRDIGPLLMDALDQWAVSTEEDREARTALVHLLTEAAEDQSARSAVLRRAQKWSGRDGRAPRTGQSLIERIAL